MSQISWDSPLVYFWETKSSKINSKTWLIRTQVLFGYKVKLFQKKNVLLTFEKTKPYL